MRDRCDLDASMTATTIRPLKESELCDLLRLWADSDLPCRSKGRDSLPNLKKQWRRDPDLFIGAFQGKKMVGAVVGSDDGRRAWINRLAVVPEARAKGIATALIRRCENVMRRRGRRLFCVHIEHDNPESMRLFAKVGYKREDFIFYYAKRERKDY